MILYHGTKVCGKEAMMIVAEFPKALSGVNGVGFYLTTCYELAKQYGNVIAYEVSNDWKCGLVRPMGKLGESELEYVLTQQEADDLVLEQAISITLEGVNI